MWFAVATAELLTVAAVGPIAPTSACTEDLTIQGMECARPTQCAGPNTVDHYENACLFLPMC